MAQRNFPPSFWNSSYQPTSSLGHDPLGSLHSASSDAYMTSQLHSMSSLGSDPWRYSLTSQSHSVPYSHNHHNVHDMAYAATMAGTSRFQPHYSSLLGPAGRLGSVSGQCDIGKHAVDGWSSRYHPETLSSSLPNHHDTTHHLHSAITAGKYVVSFIYLDLRLFEQLRERHPSKLTIIITPVVVVINLQKMG